MAWHKTSTELPKQSNWYLTQRADGYEQISYYFADIDQWSLCGHKGWCVKTPMYWANGYIHSDNRQLE